MGVLLFSLLLFSFCWMNDDELPTNQKDNFKLSCLAISRKESIPEAIDHLLDVPEKAHFIWPSLFSSMSSMDGLN